MDAQPAVAGRRRRRARRDLTFEQKMEIVRRRNAGGDLTEIASDFGINKNSIRRIKRALAGLPQLASGAPAGPGPNRTRFRRSAQPDVDAEVLRWYTTQRALGDNVSRAQLREYAIMADRELNGPAGTFKASPGWLRTFLRRHGLRASELVHSVPDNVLDNVHDNVHSEQQPSIGDTQSCAAFLQEFEDLVEEYGLENIYYLAETTLCWRSLPSKTLTPSRKSMPAGAEVLEDRVTLGACANAAGTHRLPLLFVGHFENPRSFKAFRQSCPVFYRSNGSACVTQTVFADWLQSCFVPEVDKQQLSTNSASRVLLLVEPGAGHYLADELKSERVDVMALPPSTASLIQPMHQGPITALKTAFRERLVRRLHEANDVVEFYRDYDLRDCVNFCAESWAELTECALRSAWMRLVPVLRLEEAETPTTSSHAEALAGIARLLQPLAKDIAIRDVSEWQQQLGLMEASYVPCNADNYFKQEHGAVDTSDDADALVVTNAFAVLKKWASKKSSKAKFQFDELYSSFHP